MKKDEFIFLVASHRLPITALESDQHNRTTIVVDF